MATRPSVRRRDAAVAFDAVTITGGLLSPDWLARIATLGATHQSLADYDVDKGLQLRDELGRAWRIAQAHAADFLAGLSRAKRARTDAAGDDEANDDVVRGLTTTFVTALLQRVFAFDDLHENADAITVDGRVYPLSHVMRGDKVPLHMVPAGRGLDHSIIEDGDGHRRRSAFGLVQEYLNADDAALWGICTDGLTLRLLRDNHSLSRPAFVEVDVQRIFQEERYSDFCAVWLLLHASRFGRVGQSPAESPLERWREEAQKEGTVARDRLREGVKDALVALGQGFSSQPDNSALRAKLADGTLTPQAYYGQLLRLVYRLIFLLTVEERGLLFSAGATKGMRALYDDGYSLKRLRELSRRRSAHDQHHDAFVALQIVFRGLQSGEPRLGLPALAGLFAPDQCPDLDTARLQNRALLEAVYRLSWMVDDGAVVRVNWKDMGTEELGSVYESLLELVPQVQQQGRSFAFAEGNETKGNARKTTGSYYTPHSLVQVLLDEALEPVVTATLERHSHKSDDEKAKALLGLSVVDPACGSGHFLLSAAHRLAGHVARLKAGGTPSDTEHRVALRQVVSRCLFGVDLNPMAVELCKVSLWMEAVEPGRPLTFLDAHIQQGNALLGTTPDLMKGGIPDEAWTVLEGDDKKLTSALKKRNKLARGGQTGFVWSTADDADLQTVAEGAAAVDDASDLTLGELLNKERDWKKVQENPIYQRQTLVADAWCAAFVWPKPDADKDLAACAPTEDVWQALRSGKASPRRLIDEVGALSRQYEFFHWHLRFARVWQKGGFDVVLGNPPWDSILFREEEFFAEHAPDIAQAATAAKRKKLIAELEQSQPSLFARYRLEQRQVAGVNAFVRSGVTYPLCGVGRVNLYALFAERARGLRSTQGRVGQILPSGIVSDDSTKLFFQAVVDGGELASFYDFENRLGIFPAVDSRIKFGIIVLGGPASTAAATFVFFALSTEDVADKGKRFQLTAADIALLNPDTRTCPILRTREDAELIKRVYRRLPIITKSNWDLGLQRLLNSADDSGHFKPVDDGKCLPLYEAKYLHIFNHRWATNVNGEDLPPAEQELEDPAFRIQPRHWFPAAEIESRFGGIWARRWLLVWRDISRSTDERTFIAGVVPSLAVPHTAKAILIPSALTQDVASLQANLSAFVFDFIARQKTGGTHMSTFIVEQLPVVPPSTYAMPTAWSPTTTLGEWILPRVLELTYTAWDLEAFAHDVGYDGPPFRWDPARRFELRCELDAAFFHLYGLGRDDVAYVMDTFPIVRRKDEAAHNGDFRTKRVILEIYDAMAEASRTSATLAPRTLPPPADPAVAHPPRASS